MDFLLIAASPFIGFGVAFAMNSLAVLPFRRAVGAHWTERARLIFPARKAATVNAWLTAANLAVTAQWLLGASTSIWILASTGTLLGATAGNYLLSRQVWPAVSLARWIEQTLLRACLMGIRLLLILAGACFMPTHLDLTAGIMAAGIFLALLALACGFAMVLLRGMRLIRPAPDHVHEIARCETLRAGVELNATWVHRGPAAQAYALLPMKDMLFSDALLETLSDAELAAVCAHEAGHLSESRWVFIGRLLGVLSLYPLIFVAPVGECWGAPGVAALLLVVVMILVLSRRLSRKMELRADALAVTQTTSPGIYATALEKIYAVNLIPAVMPKRSRLTHPDLYDRMLSAGITPDYERPAPPSRRSWPTVALYGAFILQLVIQQSALNQNAADAHAARSGEQGAATASGFTFEASTNEAEANSPGR